MERASGERFDRLMQRLVLQPLPGLRDGGFDPAELPAADQTDMATLYRKRRSEGERDILGSGRPLGSCRLMTFATGRRLARRAGRLRDGPRDGALLSPQGRLRMSVRDLGTLMQVLFDQGRHQGRPLPASPRRWHCWPASNGGATAQHRAAAQVGTCPAGAWVCSASPTAQRPAAATVWSRGVAHRLGPLRRRLRADGVCRARPRCSAAGVVVMGARRAGGRSAGASRPLVGASTGRRSR